MQNKRRLRNIAASVHGEGRTEKCSTFSKTKYELFVTRDVSYRLSIINRYKRSLCNHVYFSSAHVADGVIYNDVDISSLAPVEQETKKKMSEGFYGAFCEM